MRHFIGVHEINEAICWYSRPVFFNHRHEIDVEISKAFANIPLGKISFCAKVPQLSPSGFYGISRFKLASRQYVLIYFPFPIDIAILAAMMIAVMPTITIASVRRYRWTKIQAAQCGNVFALVISSPITGINL